MFLCNKRYVKRLPTESVLGKFLALMGLALKDAWSLNPATFTRNINAPDFWDKVKPSNIADKPKWMTFDDAWVDEVRRGLKACAVFCFFPIYFLGMLHPLMCNTKADDVYSLHTNEQQYG